MQNKGWIRVDGATAKSHPLYGVHGWLVAFLGLLGVGTACAIGYYWTISRGLPEPDSFQSAGFALVVCTAVVYWLAVKRSEAFRLVSVGYLLVADLIVLRIVLGEGMGGTTAIVDAFVWSLLTRAPWIAYLTLSRRVRVTFESKVRPNDPWLSAGGATASPSYQSGYQKPVEPTEAMYEQVAREIETCSQRNGLWLQCFAEAGGDEQRQVVLYTNARIRELVRDEAGLRRLATATDDDFICAYPSKEKYSEMMSALESPDAKAGRGQPSGA